MRNILKCIIKVTFIPVHVCILRPTSEAFMNIVSNKHDFFYSYFVLSYLFKLNFP